MKDENAAVLLDRDDASHAQAGRAVAVSVQTSLERLIHPLAVLKKLFRRSQKPPVEALSDVSLEVREGRIFGLIGPTALGKHSHQEIATLVQPTSGAVMVRGFDSVRDDGARARASRAATPKSADSTGV